MYAGPGSGPMLAAATGWDGLASDLYATAASFSSVISELSGLWLGPTSASMAAAAAPHAAWLNAAAEQAEQAAAQAKAVVGAYEAAFAMTVPPPVIAANRAQLMMLIATNFFGQNLPAIAATEAHYAEMWAQDAAAMYGYAGASVDASALTTFHQPPPTTDQAGQAAAVGRAADTAAGTSARSLPGALRVLASPARPSSAPTPGLTWLRSTMNELLMLSPSDYSPLGKYLASPYDNNIQIFGNHMADWEHFLKIWQDQVPAAGPGAGTETAAGLPGLGALVGGGGPVSAGSSAAVGNAGTIGNLSVPQSWAAAAPGANLASAAASLGSAGGASGGNADSLLRGVPLTGAGRRFGGVVGQRYGFRHIVVARPPAGG